eukprot:3546077-Amphidinium_carterae.1
MCRESQAERPPLQVPGLDGCFSSLLQARLRHPPLQQQDLPLAALRCKAIVVWKAVPLPTPDRSSQARGY